MLTSFIRYLDDFKSVLFLKKIEECSLKNQADGKPMDTPLPRIYSALTLHNVIFEWNLFFYFFNFQDFLYNNKYLNHKLIQLYFVCTVNSYYENV